MGNIVGCLYLAILFAIGGFIHWVGDRFVYQDHSKEWYAITRKMIRILDRQIVLNKELRALAEGMREVYEHFDVSLPYIVGSIGRLYEIAKANIQLRLDMLDDDLRVYKERRDALGEDNNE